MSTMYPGIVNSPATELDAPIDSAATTFTVINGTALPDAPNLATIGQGEIAETILYLSKSGNTLSDVSRGFEGTARNWDVNTRIARTFTHYDYETMRQLHEQHAEDIAGIHTRDDEQDQAIRTAQAAIDTHAENVNNPHGVSKVQVGLGNVPNYPAATQAQAEAGTDNASLMTPKQTTNTIDSRTRYGVTGGTATALTLNLNPAPASLYIGLEVKVKLHIETGDSPTLNVTSLGAKALHDSDGAAFSGDEGKIYTFVYDGANFIQASGGGGGGLITPNARAADININSVVANTYYTLVDITSAGRLSRLVVTGTQTNNNYRVRLRVDGKESSLATESGQAHNGRGFPHASGTTSFSATYSLDYFTDIEFKSSLKIEIMSTVATPQMQGSADYALV